MRREGLRPSLPHFLFLNWSFQKSALFRGQSSLRRLRGRRVRPVRDTRAAAA